MGLAEDFGAWKQQKDMSELSLLGVDPTIQYTANQAIKDYSANQDSDNVNILPPTALPIKNAGSNSLAVVTGEVAIR